jgi:hypothetical protein
MFLFKKCCVSSDGAKRRFIRALSLISITITRALINSGTIVIEVNWHLVLPYAIRWLYRCGH